MTWFTLLVRRLWWRKFNPVLRLGWETIAGRGPDDARIGAFLILAGWLIQLTKRPDPVLVYRYLASPGETMRVRVLRGDEVVSERVIEA